jgi:hypothetical protein
MTSAIYQLKNQQEALFRCSECGADRYCDCSAPAIVKAAKALEANPGLSDRAIAQKAGVSAPTVAKARKATVNDFTVDEPREGLDRRTRKMPRRQRERIPLEGPAPTEEEAEALEWAHAQLRGFDPAEKAAEEVLRAMRAPPGHRVRLARLERLPPDEREEARKALEQPIDEAQFLALTKVSVETAVYYQRGGPPRPRAPLQRITEEVFEACNAVANAWIKLRAEMLAAYKGKVKDG